MGGIEIGLVFLRCGRTSNFFMVVAFISANFTTHETVYIRNLDGDKKATHEAHFCYGPALGSGCSSLSELHYVRI